MAKTTLLAGASGGLGHAGMDHLPVQGHVIEAAVGFQWVIYLSCSENNIVMKKIVLVGLFALIAYLPVEAQATRRAPQRVPQQTQPQSNAERFFFGGGLGMTFGSYTRIAVQPLVGYQATPRLSTGLRLNYEYIKDKRFNPDLTASNYGAGLFGRYRITNSIYGHFEPAYYSYKYSVDNSQSTREWVPFLFLGGGFIQPIGGRSAFFIEALFDVLQNSNSPYDPWRPLITMGVTAGF